MNVAAFSTPRQLNWRWRIVGYAETVEESSDGFATIARAVAESTCPGQKLHSAYRDRVRMIRQHAG